MRILVKIEVSGSTIEEITDAAREKWKKLSGVQSEELPSGVEIEITQVGEDGGYVGVAYIRSTKDISRVTNVTEK